MEIPAKKKKVFKGTKLLPFLGSIRQQFFPAAHIFIRPILLYAAEFSASRDWEHCLWVPVPIGPLYTSKERARGGGHSQAQRRQKKEVIWCGLVEKDAAYHIRVRRN